MKHPLYLLWGKNILSFCTLVISSVLFLFCVASSSFAIDITKDPCDGGSCLQVGIDDERLPEELRNADGDGIQGKIISVINYILTFLGIALIIVVIYAGSLLIFSNGEDEVVGKAKNMILYAILGVIIIVLSYAIVTFIANVMSEGNGDGGTSTEIGTGSTGSTGATGATGASGTAGAGNEALESQIASLIEEMNQLKEQGADNNTEAINALQTSIDALELQITTPQSTSEALEKEMEILRNKIEELEKEDDPENNTEIEDLQNAINSLEDKLNSSVSDSQTDLNTLLKELEAMKENDVIGSTELEKIQSLLTSLQEKSSDNPELKKQYTALEEQINELYGKIGSPINTGEESEEINNIIQDITENIESAQKTVESLSEVRPRIILSYGRKSVPTTLSLSGEKTYVKGTSIDRLTNDHYHWSVVGPDGIRQVIGNGITRDFSIEIPGRYVFFLDVDSPAESVLSGQAIQSFSALSQDTLVDFRVGDKTSRETLRFTGAQNEQGIIFNPSLVQPKSGRKIIRYLWNFDGFKVEETEGKPVLYSFPESGKHKVSLTVTDNTNQSKKSATIPLEITQVVSYFSFSKDEYNVGEEVRFSASKSKSDNGFIQEFDWQILDESNAIVNEFQDESFSHSFSLPGRYIIRLTVKDSEGGISSSSSSLLILAESSTPLFSVEQSDTSTPASRVFDASKSSDPAGSDLTYSWDFDGDGIFEKTGLTTPIIEHLFKETGEYDIMLRTTNAFGKESFSSKSIEIKSVLTAEIETSQVVYPINSEISFIAKTNEGVAFEWNFGDGTGKQTTGAEETTHSFEKSGQYTVRLTVNDANGNKTTAKKNIFIGTIESPIAAVSIFVNGKMKTIEQDFCGSGKDGIEIFRSNSLDLSGEESINKNGKKESLDYIWNFPNNIQEKGETIDWSFLEVSEKGNCEEVSFFVEDSISGKKSGTHKLYFFVKNSVPEIESFVITQPKELTAPVSIPLSITAADTDGRIIKYSWWAQRKGSSSKDKIGFHTTQAGATTITIPAFGEEGESHEYAIYGSVEDNNGSIITTEEIFEKKDPISIKTGKNKSPKIELILDKKTVPMGDTIVFTANVTTFEGDDISHLVNYQWDFDGDNIFDKASTNNYIVHEYMVPGTKNMRVKVTFQGLVSSSSEKIIVQRVSKLPLAQFTVQKNEKGEIRFNGNPSKYDKSISGNAVEYSWDFDSDIDSDGDGIKDNDADSTEANPLYKFPDSQKSSQVTLKVLDATQGEDSVTQKIIFDEVSGIIQTSTAEEGNEDEENQETSFEKILANTFAEISDLVEEQEPSPEAIEELTLTLTELESEGDSEDQKNKIQKIITDFDVWKESSDTEKEEQKQKLQTLIFETQKEMIPESAPLLSDSSLNSVVSSPEILEKIATEIKNDETGIMDEEGNIKEDIKPSIKALEETLAKVKSNITESDTIYPEYIAATSALENIKENIEVSQSLNALQNSLAKIEQAAKEKKTEAVLFWKPLPSLSKNINKSIIIDFTTPTTTLNIYGGERYIQEREPIEIFIFTQNADGSFYSGDLTMKTIEGEGIFNPKSARSINGRGVVTFTPNSTGTAVIEITAPNTISGSISETLTFFVQEQ